jgi:ankyrin repeat protein
MLAARYSKNPEDLRILLEAGADAKAKDKLGMTAFDYAKANEKLRGTEALRMLQKASQ